MTDINAIYKLRKDDFIRATKRILKEEKPKNNSTLKDIARDIVTTYNSYINFVKSIWPNQSQTGKDILSKDFKPISDKLKLCFGHFETDIHIPSSITEEINTNIKINLSDEIGDLFDSEKAHEDLPDLEISRTDKNTKMTDMSLADFLRLAGSQLGKNYGGDPLSLQSYIDSLKLLETLATTGELRKLLVTFAISKLEGRAREAIPNSTDTVEKIVNALQTKIKPEASKVIEGKIQALRIDRMSVHDFAQKTDELAEAFRRALIVEGIPDTKAEEMTVEKAVSMCRNNARSDLVKSVLASSNFSNHKEVVAKFIVEINTAQNEKQVLTMRSFNRSNGRQRGRGGRQFGYGHRNSNNFFRNGEYHNGNNGHRGQNNNRRNNNRNYRGNGHYNGRQQNNNNNFRNNGGNNNNYNNGSNAPNVRYTGNEGTPQWGLGTQPEETPRN